MFSITVDQTHTVLLVEFSDRLQPQDLVDLDRLVEPIAAVEEVEKVVVDLRAATAVDVPLERLIERASAGPVLPGRKLMFVAASGVALGFSRQYAMHREREGHDAIPIVPDLEAAWRMFGIAAPTFR